MKNFGTQNLISYSNRQPEQNNIKCTLSKLLCTIISYWITKLKAVFPSKLEDIV